ncbi:MAG: DUF2267 domain-containing protein [Myxococcaceae bacterium]
MADEEKLELITEYVETDRDARTDLSRFLRDICDRTGLSRDQAESAAIGVLCVLDQRLSGGAGRDLAAALPAPIFSLVDRCHWDPNANAEAFDLDEFLSRVADHLDTERAEAVRLTRAVFAATRNHIPFAKRDHIESQLPSGGLKELWSTPESAEVPEARTVH